MYRTGRVYRIVCLCEPDIQYVGSTFNELKQRWQSHKKKYNHWLKTPNMKGVCSIYHYFKKYGIENFKILLIKEYQVFSETKKDRKCLNVYETLWINKLKCVNIYSPFSIKHINKLIRRDYHKRNYQENKEKKKEKSRQYYQENKEKIVDVKRQYRQNNKDKIRDKKRDYYEKNKDNFREYYEKNKEKINEKRREKTTCPRCSSVIAKHSLSKHQKSKKCLNAV
jgi:ribosomal protein S27AE